MAILRFPAVASFFLVLAAVSLPSLANASHWNCQPAGLMVTCEAGSCTAATTDLNIQLSVAKKSFSFCAFSGCWTGTPRWTRHRGSAAYIRVTNALWNGTAGQTSPASFTMMFDEQRRLLQLSGEGFHTPMTCQKE